MEYLAIALVMIFVLHLIDRNKVWKQAAKVAAVLVVLTLIGAGALYGWSAWQDHKQFIASQRSAERFSECVTKKAAELENEFNRKMALNSGSNLDWSKTKPTVPFHDQATAFCIQLPSEER